MEDIHPTDWHTKLAFHGTDMQLRNGMVGLINGMLAQVCPGQATCDAIRYETPVKHVDLESEKEKDAVVVHTDQGMFRGTSVIMTPSIGVLQAAPGTRGFIHFSPPLPPDVTDAIDGIGMGHVVKIFVRFSQVFWDPSMGMLAILEQPGTESAVFTQFCRSSTSRGRCGAMTAVSGNMAVEIEQWTATKVEEEVLASLGRAFPSKSSPA